jgi:hypothetical protein
LKALSKALSKELLKALLKAPTAQSVLPSSVSGTALLGLSDGGAHGQNGG